MTAHGAQAKSVPAEAVIAFNEGPGGTLLLTTAGDRQLRGRLPTAALVEQQLSKSDRLRQL